MTTIDLQTRIARELRDLLAGLRDLIRDPYSRRALLDQLGLRPDLEPPAEQSWDAIDRMDAILGETSPTWEQRRELVDAILEIAGVCEDFVAAGRANDTDAEIFGDIAVELIELGTFSYMRARHPVLYALARLLGFIEDFGTTYKTETFRPERWSKFWTAFHDWFADWNRGHELGFDDDGNPLDLTGPERAFTVLADLLTIAGTAIWLSGSNKRWFYGWDPAPGSASPRADALAQRAMTVELVFPGEHVDTKVPITVLYVPVAYGGPGLFVSVGAAVNYQRKLGPFDVTFELSSADGVDLALMADPGALPPREGRVRVAATWGDVDGGLVTLGNPTGTRFEFRTLVLEAVGFVDGAGPDFRYGASLKAAIRQAALVLKGLPLVANDELRLAIDSELGLAYDTELGLHLVGGAGLVVTLPFGQPIPHVQVPFIEAGLIAEARDGKTELTVHVAAALTIQSKAFTLVLDRIGYRWRLTGLGDDGMRWPTGIGVSLDLGPVSGGGYLFHDDVRDLYGGAIQLKLWSVTLSAYGIVQKVDGRWSFVVFLGLEFKTAPSVLGLRLLGVGGVWAKDRTVDVDAIASGLKGRVLDDLLFPKDLIVNAPRLVNSITQVFPHAPGQNVLGPMLKLGFGSEDVATLSIGLLFEWPDPSRTIVLGTLQATLPSKKVTAARLVIDVMGWWDHDRGESEVFGQLRDSKLASFTIQGSGSLRTRGGDQPFWGIAIGGFHPSYTPPLAFRPMDRVTIDLTGRSNPRLRFEGYLAVTSNSFQIGGKVEAVFRKAGFSLEGRLALDALWTDGTYQFGLSVTLALKRGSSTICGLHFEGVCTGPTPFTFRGKASISFFFFTVSFPFDYRSGGDAPAALPASDPTDELVAALRDPRSWGSELPTGADAAVLVRALPPAPGALRVHPLGRLTLTQNVVPLGVAIERFGPSRPSAARTFTLGPFTGNGAPLPSTPVQGDFAAGQFFELSDHEQLSRPSFEKMQAGVALGATAITAGESLDTAMEYETIVIDLETRRRKPLGIHAHGGDGLRAAVAHGAAATAARGPGGGERWAGPAAAVAVRDPAFRVVDEALTATAAPMTYTAARAAIRASGAGPARLRVIGAHERTR